MSKQENIKSPLKMLGVVTLYNPNAEETAANIHSYVGGLDMLIIWDNSPLEKNLKTQFQHLLGNYWEKIIWQGTGENRCIAPAINFAWHEAMKEQFDAILLMDDDSKWDHFLAYRQDIEKRMNNGSISVYTPYVVGCDSFSITSEEQEKRLFINSGTVIPTIILTAIGGLDEDAFPLDALDHDLALSIIEHGYKSCCLTKHKLNHSLGYPQRMGLFKIFTPNYNRHRTYSMTRSHIICYRKHKKLMTHEDRDYLFNEILRRKLLRILFAEPDKYHRLIAFFKGIWDGCNYKLKVES